MLHGAGDADASRPLGHEAGAEREHVEQRVHRTLHRAVRRRHGGEPPARRRRELALGEAVDLVVHDDVGHVDVAAACMNEVIAADGCAVAVTAAENDIHLRLCHLDAGSKSGSATMSCMQRTAVNIAGKARSAADT